MAQEGNFDHTFCRCTRIVVQNLIQKLLVVKQSSFWSRNLGDEFSNWKLAPKFRTRNLHHVLIEIFKLYILIDDDWDTKIGLNHFICGIDTHPGETCKRFRRVQNHSDLFWNFQPSYGLKFENEKLAPDSWPQKFGYMSIAIFFTNMLEEICCAGTMNMNCAHHSMATAVIWRYLCGGGSERSWNG